MKKIFTLFTLVLSGVVAMAQSYSPMKFAGAATFGGTFMGIEVTQTNESDTIVFTMNSTKAGDISHSALTFKEMGMTIPAFTVHNATFSFDMATMDATFDEQEFEEILTIVNEDGSTVEKKITGKINAAKYTMADKTFALDITFKYGNMPASITYVIAAKYVKEDSDTAIEAISAEAESAEVYDLMGSRTATLQSGRICLRNGKKVLMK